jgi:hypothetical protein
MRSIVKRRVGAVLALAATLLTTAATAAEPSLAGTWTLTAADRLKPDGSTPRGG